jgi:cell division protease FtsH
MGHAIVAHYLEGCDPVHKISVISRGQALGYTISMPTEDTYLTTRTQLRDTLAMTLGGRAAEELVFDAPTTGAESDIQQLTEIARQMISRWGMSPAIGPIAVASADGRGPFYPGGAEVSERTQELVDDEIRRIVDEAHEQAAKLLRENRGKLDSLAEALLEHETLDEDKAYAAAGVEHSPDETSGQYVSAARAAAGGQPPDSKD